MRRLWGRAFTQSNTRYLSVLDLGASAVKALVVERSDKQVTILGRGRASHQADLAQDSTLCDVDALSTACEEALCEAEDATEVTKGDTVVPDAAFIAVPTAWLRGGIGVGTVRRGALERAISADECREPITRSGRQAMRNLGRVTGAGKWELLDAAFATFSVDGRRVTDPVGFRGHLLGATSFVAAAPNNLLRTLRQIADRLQLDLSYLIAEPLGLAAAVPGDGLIVEVGACTTGLILARYGVPLAFGSVSQGGATLTQALADAFALSLPRAEALRRAYDAGQLGASAESAVCQVLQDVTDTWLSAVLSHLQSWGDVSRSWPPNIYLCGGASLLPEVQDAVSTAGWLSVLPFPRSPEVRIWDGSNLSQVIDRAEARWQVDNVVLISLAAWALRDRGPATPEGVLQASLGIELAF